MQFYSHPQRALSNHIEDVAQRMQSMLVRTAVREPDREEWRRLLHHLACCHDFGKYTSFFQRHLAGDRSVGQESYHSLMGALFGSYVEERMRDTIADWKSPDFYSGLVVYFIILQHHGHLRDFLETIPSMSDYVPAQLLDLKQHQQAIQHDLLNHFPQLAPHLYPFLAHMEELLVELNRKHDLLPRLFRAYPELDLSLALKVQMAFSFLIDADKHSAAENKSVAPSLLSSSLVEAYRVRKFSDVVKPDDPMAIKRNLVKQIVTENVSQSDLSQSFHTFTAPTGTGKTLAALEGALILRERLAEEGLAPRRIIYVLPFTSIIDQNYTVMENVISPSGPDQHLVLKHHYMNDIAYEGLGNKGEVPLDRQLMFIESWESEVIVTTYVQLLHTMLGNQNRQLKKLHNLASAIVILDEVQNVPFAYWSLTEQLCKAYSSQFDNKWVLLTATQPKIFPAADTIEWLEHRDHANTSFFEDMNRTEIHLVSDSYLDMETWLEEATAYVDKAESALIIVNTIATSMLVYDYFCEQMDSENVFYLSANLIFEHRKRILKRVRQRLNKGLPIVLVSTQVIEAGVDVDFHCVIRDLGPMDSIIQAAGRCNRHGLRAAREPVVIIPLKKDGARKADSAIVYDLDAHIALETMVEFREECGGGIIPESAYQRMVDSYYLKLLNTKEDGESWTRLTQLSRLEFDQLSSFSLIPQKKPTVPVFIQYNWKAVWFWNYFVNKVCQEPNLERRRENYLRCKSKLRQFQLDVDPRYVRIRNMEYGFVLIRLEWVEAGQYYDRNKGWVRDPKDEEAFVW
jgi:CRISPR-associated endonuclease/helicase Cas3